MGFFTKFITVFEYYDRDSSVENKLETALSTFSEAILDFSTILSENLTINCAFKYNAGLKGTTS